MLDVLGNFAVAIATGIAVLAFYRPEGWDRVYLKVVASVGCFGVLCLILVPVVSFLPANAYTAAAHKALVVAGIAAWLICGWAWYMHWLTKEF